MTIEEQIKKLQSELVQFKKVVAVLDRRVNILETQNRKLKHTIDQQHNDIIKLSRK
ncbi:MAG: hypothetical protein ACXW2E_01715 [Nitrososphaeraceae archaeon]